MRAEASSILPEHPYGQRQQQDNERRGRQPVDQRVVRRSHARIAFIPGFPVGFAQGYQVAGRRVSELSIRRRSVRIGSLLLDNGACTGYGARRFCLPSSAASGSLALPALVYLVGRAAARGVPSRCQHGDVLRATCTGTLATLSHLGLAARARTLAGGAVIAPSLAAARRIDSRAGARPPDGRGRRTRAGQMPSFDATAGASYSPAAQFTEQ
jgi:hypothetical protein